MVSHSCKPDGYIAKPAASTATKISQKQQAEDEVSSQTALPTAAHSTNPADYNHTVLPASSGISRRRPRLVIPTLHGQLPLAPIFDHCPSSSDSQPKSQPQSSLDPPSQADISPSLPYTPVDQITHTPLLPPEMPRFPREKTNLRVTLAHQSSSGCDSPILSPRTPQDASSPLLHVPDTLRPRNASLNPRPLLRPRQLSYFHSAPTVSDYTSSSKIGGTVDTNPGVLRTESLASPLILFQPNLSSSLKRAL